MDNELLKQLQELRERSRFERDFNPAGFLAERIETGALKIPEADRASFASQPVHLRSYGAFTTPENVLETIALSRRPSFPPGVRSLGRPWRARRAGPRRHRRAHLCGLCERGRCHFGKALALSLNGSRATIDVISSVLPFIAD